jgi:hypothetical protein
MKPGLLIALAALVIAAPAFAQTPAPDAPAAVTPTPSPEVQAARKAMRQACAGDVQSLCAGQRGREAMMCLRQNAEKVSSPCKEAIAKAPGRRQRPRAA